VNINKDTKIYGSFSLNAGNNGNIFFNKYFRFYDIDAIYKSFSIDNIESAVKAAKTLNFGGFAVSMPFKKEVINFVDDVSNEVKIIGASNTIINKNGKLIAYNTDYMAIKSILLSYIIDNLIILGNGGMASAAEFAADELNIDYKIIKRDNWNDILLLRNTFILNCTPVRNILIDESNIFIDTLPDSEMGKKIHSIQAKEQFYLYTGIKI
jgi:shikimate dehydrogenase